MRNLIAALVVVFAHFGCASGPAIQTQDYAALNTEQVLEYDMETVWKAIEKVLSPYKVAERKTYASAETDWIYSRSRDKYHSYEVNGSPRKQYLQMRLRYIVKATRAMGGVRVLVDTEEEVERLKADGSPDGYTSVAPDSARAHEFLEKIRFAILSAAP